MRTGADVTPPCAPGLHPCTPHFAACRTRGGSGKRQWRSGVSNNSDGAGVAGFGDETAFAALARGSEPTRTALERSLLAMLNHAPSLMFIKDSEYRYLF